MNKRDVRDRMIRLVISSLVREELTLNEQRAVLSLLRDTDFYLDLHDTVGSVFSALEEKARRPRLDTTRNKKLEAEREDTTFASERSLEEIQRLVRRKRLSKVGLLNTLKKINFELAGNMSEDASLSLIIESFFIHSSEDERSKLLELLRGEKHTDEYLQGIAERNNP